MKSNTKLFQENSAQLMTDDKQPFESAAMQQAEPGEQPGEKKVYYCDLTGTPFYL